MGLLGRSCNRCRCLPPFLPPTRLLLMALAACAVADLWLHPDRPVACRLWGAGGAHADTVLPPTRMLLGHWRLAPLPTSWLHPAAAPLPAACGTLEGPRRRSSRCCRPSL
eukprot:8661026-Alexandrium_andersonii.AAC.1